MYALAFLLAICGCGQEHLAEPRPFDAEAALAYAGAQVAFGPRIPGTPGHAAEAHWLDSLLSARADTLVAQRWTHVDVHGKSLELVNFVARFNPAATKRVLFLAHWDTRPRSDGTNAQPADSATPVPGANDGASGVSVLLGVADALKAAPPAIGVDLLFVDGEDYGDFFTERNDVLIGSRYYGAHQVGPKPLYAVLFDMVGDKNLRISQEGNSMVGAGEVVDLVWDTARRLGYGAIFVPYDNTTLVDDHVELQQAGIRAIDVVDFDYPYWHTPHDTMDKISAQSLGIVGRVALALVAREEPR
jgi:Zn-dependent M28 family amino/carboxypeptidase